ncbi:sigma-70 family RNA polymerase sigma factor [Roseateles saccharophilus]|uniref:sigma-70 family RNA polymerase sigma factor n=1 Tax=Roseateles saccharophilus TaxID=304 RepID=UPI0038F6126D
MHQRARQKGGKLPSLIPRSKRQLGVVIHVHRRAQPSCVLVRRSPTQALPQSNKTGRIAETCGVTTSSVPLLAELEDEDDLDNSVGPTVPDETYVGLERKQALRQIVNVVERLPAPERRVVFTHYFQLHTFEEIAFDMGLTKGRVSQLHHAALRRIREWGSAKDLPR